ncbi:DUF3575 domain-containing protein [uncultured Dokdonia sp.]|uniref:DUF3575 domain-containing protein n=1 Tax=uncultured Dokdonia sp. TaxID=575653 RepID=UPI002639B3A9|nr:DUF3575 domain-containing protein [uncultured Dokdonia sp.]
MKNKITFLFLAITTIAFAQEDADDQPVNLNEINNKKHEFRIDVLESLALPALDISYEYVLSKYSGVGASININFQDEDSDFRQEFAFTPYYRQYFFNKKDYGARGFFAEGLLQYATGENGDFLFGEDGLDESERGTWNKFGVGVAIGQKWVSRNGFVIELSLGGGRYLGGDDRFSPEGFFRGGISFGYRF